MGVVMGNSVQSLSHVLLSATPWTTARQASLFITNLRSLLKLMSIESVMPSNHLLLCCPPLLLPSIFPTITVFSNESVLCIRWPKYCSFSISPSNEYSGLISFRMDWFELLAVQGTLKSLLQHHSSKASIPWHSALFIVQLSHQYMTTGKTIGLTRQNFVGKVMSLLFHMLSRLVITFLPSSTHLLISWLQSPSAMILEPKKRKSLTVSIVSPSICHEVMGPDAMTLVFWMLNFKPTFSLSSFTFIKRLFSSSLLSAIGWYHLHIWGYWYFSWQITKIQSVTLSFLFDSDLLELLVSFVVGHLYSLSPLGGAVSWLVDSDSQRRCYKSPETTWALSSSMVASAYCSGSCSAFSIKDSLF